jgi:hypothetical protein
MPRKSNEAKSHLSAEGGGAAPAPIKRKRTTRAKSAVQSQAAAKAVVVTASDGPQKAVAAASPGAGSIDLISEQEEIARLAYLYWEARGGQGGSAEDDWFRAEQDVLKRRTSAAN